MQKSANLSRVPSFQMFMLRREAIHLYRNIWRLTRHLDPSNAREIRKMARNSFVQNENASDVDMIKFLIADGRKQIKILQDSVYMVK